MEKYKIFKIITEFFAVLWFIFGIIIMVLGLWENNLRVVGVGTFPIQGLFWGFLLGGYLLGIYNNENEE